MKADPKFIRIFKVILYRILHSCRSPHRVVGRCCRLRIEFSSDSSIGEAIYANSFERIERSVIDHLVLAGSTVLDIGANNGFYSCLFASKVGVWGKVIAFEPTPYAYEELCRNIQINGFESRVECHCQALDMREGVATLRVFSGTGSVYNSLSTVRAPTGQLPSEEIAVPTVSLDYILGTLCERFISFIKIDVEGFERDVLRGAESLP